MSDFDRVFVGVIGLEGGYTNDPRDPGGETKFGICKRDYPSLDIKNLTIEVAKDIYQKKYWDVTHCDSLPWPLNAFVFDCAVNQGPEVAIKLLQKSLGTVQDGVLGNNTLTAIGKADKCELPALYLADRALRYTGTRNFDIYGRGWLKRLFKLVLQTEV